MSLLKFLTANSTSNESNWSEILTPHLQQGNLKPLQLILRHAMLRRVKETSLPDLPKIFHKTILTPLGPIAQDHYDIQFEKFLVGYII